MTRRERVLAALRHEETDVIPHNIALTGQALDRLARATGDPGIADRFGNHLHMAEYAGWPGEVPGRPMHFRDAFGVVWNRSGADRDIGVVDAPLIEDLECRRYTVPPPDIRRFRADIEGLLASRGDRFALVGLGFCMFERAWSLAGMENVLAAMAACPEALESLLDEICGHFLQLVDAALEYDLDAIHFGDDWGQQRGLIMGPRHWRRFIKPRMARLYERVKAGGRFVFQHSCGDCGEIFPDLVEIGLDCYQTFQPEVYDIRDMKRRYGGKITFWGGISTQRALPYMTPEELRREIVRVGEIMRPGGGFILAPTHSVPGDVPPGNILAMSDAFENQPKYFV